MAPPGLGLISACRNVLSRRFFLALCVALVFAQIVGRAFSSGHRISPDFGAMYAASLLLQTGKPELIDFGRTFTPVVAQVLHRPIEGFHPWPYPPVARGVVYPLAWFPIEWAFTLAMVLGVLLYVFAVARIVGPRRDALSAALAFPAVGLAIAYGHLSFLTTAVFGWGLALLPNSPARAGAILALVAFKPQFGLLIPVALVAGKRWRALLSAAGAGIALGVVATAMFGWQAWIDFLRLGRGVAGVLVEQSAVQHAFQSVVSAASAAGAGARVAWAAQGLVTVGAAAAVWWVWSGEATEDVKAATLVVATLLAVPHLGEYDLVLLAIPMAFLVRDATARGWRAAPERYVLLAAWIVPAIARGMLDLTRVSAGPLVSIALLWVAMRRARVLQPVSASSGTMAST